MWIFDILADFVKLVSHGGAFVYFLFMISLLNSLWHQGMKDPLGTYIQGNSARTSEIKLGLMHLWIQWL